MKKGKKILIVPILAVCLILAVFLVLVATAPSRVEGRWQCNVGYLEKYGCEAINSWIFNDDGTFLNVISDADTEEILNTSAGTWNMSLFEVTGRRIGQDGSTPFTYNPITNILNNGGGFIPLNGDVIFYKVH